MLSAVSAVQLYLRQTERLQKAVSDDPQVRRETDYFLANISSIKSARDLVANPRLLAVATTAFGLNDMAYAKAFLTKLMDDGLDKPDSLANKLVDKRFRALVEAFNFGDLGAVTTLISARMDAVVANYRRQILEDRAGVVNPAARIALYFQRQAPALNSGMEFLADKALYQFARTTLDLPATPIQSEEGLKAAAKVIENRINLAELKTTAGVDKLASRFAAMWDIANPSAQSPPLGLSPLSGPAGISLSTLLQMQNKF